MIRAGIIGCGKVADQHASQIRRIHGAQIAAVCDSEPLMALQLYDRFKARGYFTSVEEMLRVGGLDVVHITSPPKSHFQLAKMCLESGCHVYVEKPFTLNTAEAEELVNTAARMGLKLTAGHNAQFTSAMVRMRGLVNGGYLGGDPVHMESIFCYNFGDKNYAKALLGDKDHWVRKLPGSLLQNLISHGISKIAEFIKDDNPRVTAHGFTSSLLKSIGEGEIIDEVRVIIEDRDNTTAYFTFSSQISPTFHQFRLFGPKNSLIVDDDHQVVIKSGKTEYKSYAKFFIPPFLFAWQYLENFGTNLGKFVRRDFHLPFDAGMKTLIESFYVSIIHDGPPPIPYKQILLVTKIMDQIFMQIGRKQKR